ncbi:YoaK family protein [Kitasatospora sp. NPDC006697]|uniref:YoaK family protein n=1 Tax=Kitasatospora sp. NPDC006697 TaxID=3364020 RepID=UPI0036CFD95B
MRALVRGAWRTMVPGAGDPHGPLPPLLLGLTVLSGIIDAVSYLMLGHVFVANMTGNVVFLGFALAGAPGFSVASQLVALAAFAVGAFLGGRLLGPLVHRGRALLRAALAETVLVAAAALVLAVDPVVDTGTPQSSRYLVTAVLALAMGIQNALVAVLAVPELTTTVLTRTITAVFADSGRSGRLEERGGRQLLSVLTLAAGAVIGAFLVLHTAQSTALAVPAALAAVVTLAAAGPSRSAGSWTRQG